MNVSKQHREDLLRKIQQIRTYIASAQQDQNTGNLLQYLDELTKDVKGKKYGLVFEQHREAIDETLETHVPVLTEHPDLFIDNGGQMNFLIEGDNLASLQLLEKTHKGKIDVIYIDPPYNTGAKDWKYNNDYVDGNDTFRHSKWLSMMRERLLIAKDLLSNSGILVCAIDRYELMPLGMLMYEVFGEDNSIGTITVVHKPEGRNQEKFFATSNEFALFFAKDITKCIFQNVILTDEKLDEFNLTDEIGEYKLEPLIAKNHGRQGEDKNLRINRPHKYFPIYVSPDFNKLSVDKIDGYIPVYPITKQERTWKYDKETCKTKISQNEIVVDARKNIPIICEKYRTEKGELIKTHWIRKEYNANIYGTKILTDILLSKGIFDFPKSLYLMIDIIKTTTPKNALVLDFFAGSGTTGHAVMKLNAEDGGKRRFILCTNNENNICRDVTYERLKTVITGKRKDGSEYSEKYDASLKYYKIDFVKIDDKMYYEYADELLLHIRELVELENGINFNGNAEIAIVLTDEEMENFVADGRRDAARHVSILYRGHDVLMTAEQEAFLQEKGIKVNVIPDYYYNELNR